MTELHHGAIGWRGQKRQLTPTPHSDDPDEPQVILDEQERLVYLKLRSGFQARVHRSKEGLPTAIAFDPDGAINVRFHYDDLGRNTRITRVFKNSQDGQALYPEIHISWTDGDRPRLSKVVDSGRRQLHLQHTEQKICVRSPVDHQGSRLLGCLLRSTGEDVSRDQLGRPVEAHGLKFRYVNRNTVLIEIPFRGRMILRFNSVGQLLRIEEHFDETNRRIEYVRDSRGRIRSVRNSAGRSVSLAYNGNGSTIKHITLPSGCRIKQDYGPGARLERLRYPDGRGFINGYDTHGRLADRAVTGFCGVQTERFYYGETGELKKLSAEYKCGTSIVTRYRYNALANLEQEVADITCPNGNALLQTVSRFDETLRRCGLAYGPRDDDFEYFYDALDRCVRVIAAGKPCIDIDFAPDGSRRVSAGNAQARYGPDASYLKLIDGAFRERESVVNSKDSCGRIRRTVHQRSGLVQEFEYDQLGQLLRECMRPIARNQDRNLVRCAVREYLYDDIGNLIKIVKEHDSTRSTELHLAMKEPFDAQSIEGIDVSTDQRGFIDHIGEWRLESDYRGRITKARSCEGQVVEYFYDAPGRLVMRKSQSSWLIFQYDGYRVVGIIDKHRGTCMTLVYGDSLQEILFISFADKLLLPLQDSRWSVLGLYDEHGRAYYRRVYTAFGESCAVDDAEEVPAFLSVMGEVGLGFAGSLEDRRTGLCWMRARWYAPKIGRFISPDPLWLRERLDPAFNSHAYCGNDPVNNVDPLGLTWMGPAHEKMTRDACKKVSLLLRQKLDCETMARCNSAQDNELGAWMPGDYEEGGHGTGDVTGGNRDRYIADRLANMEHHLRGCCVKEIYCEFGKVLHAVQDWHAHHGMSLPHHMMLTGQAFWRKQPWLHPDHPTARGGGKKPGFVTAEAETEMWMLIFAQWLATVAAFKKAQVAPAYAQDQLPNIPELTGVRTIPVGSDVDIDLGLLDLIGVNTQPGNVFVGHPVQVSWPFDGSIAHMGKHMTLNSSFGNSPVSVVSLAEQGVRLSRHGRSLDGGEGSE